MLVAIVAGCKGLAQAEALTAEMSVAARRRLGLARRVADTTLRDLLCMRERWHVNGEVCDGLFYGLLRHERRASSTA